MYIDRMIPKAIRENDSPIENMLESLEEFANTIGGSAWRQGRARSTSISRSIDLYLDEDFELLHPDERPDYCEGESEEIEISFSAIREADEDDATLFFNTYKLSYETSLPLGPRSDDIPEPYASHLIAAIAADKEDREDARRENEKNGIQQSDDDNEPKVFVETNMVEYTIAGVDGAIEYLQTIDYQYGDVPVSGAVYDSDLEVRRVHHKKIDGHAKEFVMPGDTITQEAADNLGERALIANDLEKLVTDPALALELVGTSNEENARRILGILTLISCNIRPYRPEYKD